MSRKVSLNKSYTPWTGAGAPRLSYTPWDENEDAKLWEAYEAGYSVSKLAKQFERTKGGITSRLLNNFQITLNFKP